MIVLSSLLFFFFVFINANEQYHLGIINHHTKWHINCPENNTQIINPPLNDQPLISYQCPYRSLPIDIVPIEIDFTFICRLESRLIWIIIDIYQYNDWLWSKNVKQMNISIKLNQEISINDSKSEINNYKNRFIMINAFYIPFENLKILFNKPIEIFIQINQCKFYIKENSTWNNIIQEKCNSIRSKTLQIQYAQCDFFPKLLPIDTNHNIQMDNNFEDSSTNIPDFHVVLSIDNEEESIETTTTTTTTTTTITRLPDYHLLFDEHHKNIVSSLEIITRASNLLIFIFIFTIIIVILLIILFIYTLCYHYHIRLRRKSTLFI